MVSDIFSDTLHNSTPIELTEMTTHLTRLLSLVIGVFEKIDNQITSLDQKLDTLERLPSKTQVTNPQFVDHVSPISVIENQEINPVSTSSMDDELRAAIRQQSNQNNRIPSKLNNVNTSNPEIKKPFYIIKPQNTVQNHSLLHIELKEVFQRLHKTM